MGFLKKIGKSISKGIKKAFRGVGNALKKAWKNPIFRVAVIAAGAVFTAGLAAGALGLSTSGGLLGTLSSSSLTSGIFSAGSSLGTSVASGLSAIGSGAASGGIQTAALTEGAALGTPTALQATAGTAAAEAASAGLSNYTLAGGLNAAGSAAGGGAGLLGKIAAGGKALMNMSPGSAILAGNVLQSLGPSEEDLLREQRRRERQSDNRWGVNNYSGESMDISGGPMPGFIAPNIDPNTRGILSRASQQLQPRAYN